MLLASVACGVFVIDKAQIVDSILFEQSNISQYTEQLSLGQWIEPELQLIEKYSSKNNLSYVGHKEEQKIPCVFSLKERNLVTNLIFAQHADAIKDAMCMMTRAVVKQRVTDDVLVIHTIKSLRELAVITNMLSKRVREWYEIYNPEFSQSISSHEAFMRLILEKDKNTLLADIAVDPRTSMGRDLAQADKDALLSFAEQAHTLFDQRQKLETYLESVMQRVAPNVTAIVGALIGAKMLDVAGSLARLAHFPAGTIQLLGAEDALFRHLRSGAASPKYGFLFEHPLVSQSQQKGRTARMLANKISIAAKVDLHQGEFIGDALLSQVEKKVQ